MMGCREVVVAVAALGWPLAAHAGDQRVMGRLSATSEVQVVGWRGLTVTIEPPGGEVVTVAVAAGTEIDRDGRRVAPTALEPSDWIEVDFAQVRSGEVVINQARRIRAASRPASSRTRRGRRPH